MSAEGTDLVVSMNPSIEDNGPSWSRTRRPPRLRLHRAAVRGHDRRDDRRRHRQRGGRWHHNDDRQDGWTWQQDCHTDYYTHTQYCY
ncbi:hypothetical protein NS14008_38430 [Nocardia seriolae]|nr:hypothetical protein NS14008_38430 [Nocardia seriolae]